MTNELSFFELLLIVSGVVVLAIAIAAAFIFAVIAYGFQRRSHGEREIPSLQLQVIEEENLPKPVRIEMYTELLDKAIKQEDFEFASVLREKLKALQS